MAENIIPNTPIEIQDLDILDNVINNIGIQTSYGTWASDNIKIDNKDIVLEFVLLISLNYSNKQEEYDFLMNSDLERINFKKNLIKQISNNENLKINIINILIQFLKNKQLILENRNFDIQFNLTEEGIIVKCKINTDNDFKKKKLQLYTPTLQSYLKIDFLEDLKIKYYVSSNIIKVLEAPSYIKDINNNTDIVFVYLINKDFNINIKENFYNKTIFIEQEILQNLINLNVNRPISIKYNQNLINNLSKLKIKFKIENNIFDSNTDNTRSIKNNINKLYKNLYKAKIKTVNKYFTFYDLLDFSPFDTNYMNYFINNLCIKNNNEISKNCFNNIKFDTNPYCSVIKQTPEHSNKNEKNIINILYKDNTNTKCASNAVNNCILNPNDILDVKKFIISKLIRPNCTYSDIIYYNNNFNKTTLEHVFKLIIYTENKITNLEQLFNDAFIDSIDDHKKKPNKDDIKILTYTQTISGLTGPNTKTYKIGIENEIYEPCITPKSDAEKSKEIITPTAKLNYIKDLFKKDFKLNVSPNSELYDHINSYLYSSISKDEFFSTLKKLDYSAKNKYILYRIKGLIKTFLKTVIQKQKKILNKDVIISNFKNMIFNPITEELLLAHLLHYLNSYNNNNEYDLNFVIKCKMDNEEVSQSKFKHLIDIFTPMETTNIELEKLKIMNVDEKYKYFYITKGNTYDKTKKTPEMLNELQFKLLISMSNNQINEYLRHLEKKNTNSSNILNNFKSFMNKDNTINLFSSLYNKTLVGGNSALSQSNSNYLDIIYSHVFFNSTQQYIGQNINNVIIHKTPSADHSKIYTIGNSGHLYSIHKPDTSRNEYSEVYQITNIANKKVIKEYLKYNFISMNICNNFIFILANNIENKQFIICKNLDPKGDETSNYTEYAIPIQEKLINIKYNHIYVDTNVSTNRELNTFNIYIISNNSIFKFTIGDILSDAQHTKFIYNNTYTFKNNFIKLNAKNYCVIRKKNSDKTNTKNVTYLLLDPDKPSDFNSNNINNLTMTLANSYDPTLAGIVSIQDDLTHTHAHMHPHHNNDPIYHTHTIIADGEAADGEAAVKAAAAKAEADKAKAEADKAKAEAAVKAAAAKAEADKAKAEADKAKAEADKAKAEADKSDTDRILGGLSINNFTFSSFDKDNKGYVTKSEFDSRIKELIIMLDTTSSITEAKKEELYSTLFEMIDINVKDDKITETEFNENYLKILEQPMIKSLIDTSYKSAEDKAKSAEDKAKAAVEAKAAEDKAKSAEDKAKAAVEAKVAEDKAKAAEDKAKAAEDKAKSAEDKAKAAEDKAKAAEDKAKSAEDKAKAAVPLTEAELLKQKGEKAIKDKIHEVVTDYIDGGLLQPIKAFYKQGKVNSMYHPKIAELETGIKSLKTKILGIPIQNFKENIRGLIIDDINSLKKLYAELSVEKKGTLSFKTGGFPIPPAQSPSSAPSPPPEEKIVYNKIFDILVEKLLIVQGKIIMCGDDYFYEKCDETFQTIKMKNIIVNKYKKTSSPKPYYYIVEEFDTNKLYIGNNIEMLSSNVTARLKFDYEFKLIEPGKYDLTNVKLDNIYYNDYNLIIFNKETVNGDKVNYYYEFIRDNSNSFILLKKVKLDFDYKNIYIHEDNTNQEGILKIYLYGMNRTMMSLFIKLDNIKLNIKDKDNNPKSNLEYRGITKVYNKKDSKYTRKQLYYPNNNITTDYKGTELINYIDGFKIDTNILNIDKTSYKNKLKNLLNKSDVTDNYYYDVIGTHLRINLTKGLPVVKDIDLTNTDNNFDIKNFGVFYTKEFDTDNLHIPIDKDNLNGDICKMVDYELDFFINNKSKYDVSTCCLEITTGGNKIWLKPTPNKINNIYHFKENIRNILRLEELNNLLDTDNIKLLIYYNGKLGRQLSLENINSKNVASRNTSYLFNEEYKIYNVVTNSEGIKEYTELKTEPGKLYISDLRLLNILILSKDLQENIIYKKKLHNTYIKLNEGEKYLEFSMFNKLKQDDNINHIRLKIYKSSIILQNKPTKLKNILDKIIYNLSYKDLYKYYNNKQVKDNIKQLGSLEINHLVKLYKHKKYEKLVNYLNEYKDTKRFPLIYNSLLLKLTVQEQLEFGKIFQEYTSKQEECKNNTLPNQLPYVSRKIEVETVSIQQEKFRNMIENDTNNKTLYVEYGTFRDYDKINKIVKKTPSDEIKYRLVVIPLLLNNHYSLSYDTSDNKNLYNLPKYLEKEMKNLNTSSVNVVMKKLIKNSINDIYRKIENNYINNTETPENIYNKVIVNTQVTYNASYIGGNIKKQLIKGGVLIPNIGTIAESITEHINISNISLGKEYVFPENTSKVEFNKPKDKPKDTSEPPSDKDKKTDLDLSDKCKALTNEIDKLKNELETTKNKLNIIDQNNLWDNLLKDGNVQANFNKMQNNNNLSNEQKQDYRKINDYIVKIKNLEKERYETKLLEEQKKLFNMYNKDLKEMDSKKEEDINLMEESINNKLKSLENMSKQKDKANLSLEAKERDLASKNFEIQNLNKMLADRNKSIKNRNIEIENAKKEIKKCNNDKKDYDKLKAEYDLREKKISELNNKINLLNNKKKQEALNKIDEINTRKKELNNLQIKEDIKNELKNKTKKIKKSLDPNKKIEKKCKGNMIDCLLKDEKIHTDYKNSFKLVKDASFDEKIFKKKQNIPCIPRNDCSVCPKLSKGTPNSVRLNNNDKVEVFEKYKKNSNTDNLPTCPYSSCDSCDNSNYRLFNNAFNDKLMEKYGRGKK